MMKPKLVALHFLDEILSILVTGLVLFLASGRIGWWPAWAVIGVWLVWFTAMDIVIFRLHPGLVAERLTPPGGAKSWDRVILSVLRLVELARYILGGLDHRFGWTGNFPASVQITALAVCLTGTALFMWALASNTYFSQIVRIQSDRSHAVATGGPYAYIRHPGYAAMILYELALSALLASWWAILAGGLCVILIILRTALEDRTLKAELPGYADYARRVHYRLVPGLW
jgi:protein-S-isoprenylcysteine O-methyltransferase Ste14